MTETRILRFVWIEGSRGGTVLQVPISEQTVYNNGFQLAVRVPPGVCEDILGVSENTFRQS
jgi:hypothetical protein